MGLNKHDVTPNDIFRLQRGSAADRRVIAEYCVQDCELCNHLAGKLQIVANNMGMANVCSVPLSFIFMRGQGVKIFSLVAKQCRDDGMLIPTRYAKRNVDGTLASPDGEDDQGYEGAIVLEPQTGMYLDDPVTVLDYNSLYPSSMISENLSHDSLVIDPAYANVPGVEYVDISYDKYEGKGAEKRKVGVQVCRFAQQDDKAVLPRILQRLLQQRKATRKRIEFRRATLPQEDDDGAVRDLVGPYDEKARTVDGVAVPEGVAIVPAFDAFQRAVMDGLQLAYKVSRGGGVPSQWSCRQFKRMCGRLMVYAHHIYGPRTQDYRNPRGVSNTFLFIRCLYCSTDSGSPKKTNVRSEALRGIGRVCRLLSWVPPLQRGDTE